MVVRGIQYPDLKPSHDVVSTLNPALSALGINCHALSLIHGRMARASLIPRRMMLASQSPSSCALLSPFDCEHVLWEPTMSAARTISSCGSSYPSNARDMIPFATLQEPIETC